MPESASPHSIDQIQTNATETPSALILTVEADVQAQLQRLRAELKADGSDAFSSNEVLHEVFEWLTCNSEYEFVLPEETGDLTDAPLLCIRDDQGNVVHRWGFMDYQLRSPQDDLADTGQCVFVA